ncbi:MAG: copper-translocating P-type ATPase [Oscillospiraceae bacterium]|nr:copper-translocating P-type ATPase [Candidatus Equicaccousia limihippi]
MTTKIFAVFGMSCAACSARIERVIGALDGVHKISVNLASEKMSVTFDQNKISVSDIIKKTESLGFSLKEKAEAGYKEKEIKNLLVRLVVSLIFSVPLLYITTVPAVFGENTVPQFLSMEQNPKTFCITALLLSLGAIICGFNLYIKGVKALFSLSPNMDSLIFISTAAAFIYSCYSTVLVLGENVAAAKNTYFESVGTIITLILLGRFIEEKAKGKTGDAVKKLMSLAPHTAILITPDGEKTILPQNIKKGDLLRVPAGAEIPADGIITSGETTVDEGMLTGESLPVIKTAGDTVMAATLNLTGAVSVQASCDGDSTAFAKTLRLIEDAGAEKAPISRTADRIAGVFGPVVCATSLLAAAVWMIVGKDFSFALKIFVSVLVNACPCALGLSTPTAVTVGLGVGASRGILIKNGAALQNAQAIDTVVLDKTGTVTVGKPAVEKVLSFKNENEILSLASGLERNSTHPLGAAIIKYAKEKGILPAPVCDVTETAGGGICGTSQDKKIVLGNIKFLEKCGINILLAKNDAKKYAAKGSTAVFLAVDGQVAGGIIIADQIKESAAVGIKSLEDMGISVIMLTGDNAICAQTVANAVGIKEFKAELLPQDKQKMIEELNTCGKKVLMAGDGINDAPALKTAAVGIALSSGTDIAFDSSDIVLIKNVIYDIPAAIRLSKKTVRTIKQNLFWAFCYNTVAIPIAAGVLYPVCGVLLSPVIAAAAMSLSSISVLLNSLRLKNAKITEELK